MNLEIPDNPAELAAEVALWRLNDPNYGVEFEPTREEELDIVWLEQAAQEANLMGGWTVGAHRAFVTPRSLERGRQITLHILDEVFINGNFACYSRVSIGEIVGIGAVRAICMTFDSGLLIKPKITELEPEDMLHVPVLSVEEISRPV